MAAYLKHCVNGNFISVPVYFTTLLEGVFCFSAGNRCVSCSDNARHRHHPSPLLWPECRI